MTNICEYLTRCYGEQAGESYLQVMSSPFNYKQFEQDNKDVAKLIDLFDEIEEKGMTNNERYYTWEGLTLSTSQWARFLNIRPESFRCRFNRYGLSKKTFESNSREVLLTWQGETKSYKEWSEKLNISYNALKCRISKYGFTEEVFSVRAKEKSQLYSFNGQTKTISEWAKALNISYSSFYRRIKVFGHSNPLAYQKRKEKMPQCKPQHQKKTGPKGQLYTWNNKTLTAQEWATELGISNSTFRKRIRQYGENSELTYSPTLLKKKTNVTLTQGKTQTKKESQHR